jgi:hypothetical protein
MVGVEMEKNRAETCFRPCARRPLIPRICISFGINRLLLSSVYEKSNLSE